MQSVIVKSFKDMLSSTVLLFVMKVTLISLLVTALLLWSLGGNLNNFMSGYLQWLPFEWLQTTGATVASIALVYMLFIITLSIVTSIMVEPLLIQLAAKHYPEKKVVGAPNISTSILLSVKSALILLFVFLFTFPVMFIPLVGAVYMLWLWSILIKSPTIYDVSSLFLESKEEVKEKTKKTTVLAMIAAGFNYIPVFNIFSAVFAQILFLHHILGQESA